jgi:type IV pilus assembly protein PilY1
VYGGDLQGNLWRFDLRTDVVADWKATLLAKLDAKHAITTRPELGKVDGKPIVFVGSGRYLGNSDIVDDAGDITAIGKQAFWGVIDDGSGATRVRADLRQIAYNGSGTEVGTVSGAATKGWVLDMTQNGERIIVDPTLQLGAIAFVSNVPSTDACSPGGDSYLTVLSYASGERIVSSTTPSRMLLGNALGTGLQLVRTADGKLRAITQLASGEIDTRTVPTESGKILKRRVSWRELF